MTSGGSAQIRILPMTHGIMRAIRRLIPYLPRWIAAGDKPVTARNKGVHGCEYSGV